jgi:uncharacterized phage protein (TIGR02218 family)
MKSASGALITLLATNQFFMADLFTFTLVNGTILRYTTGDADLVSGGNTFLADGPRLKRTKTHWKIGLDVDEMDIEVYPRATDLVNGVAFLTACLRGAFDGAVIQVERAFMATYGDTSAGTVITFAGRVAEIDLGRTIATFKVNSHLELLNMQMPRNLYQPGCLHTLYDSGCTLVKATFSLNKTVGSSPTLSVIPVPGTGQAAGYYDLGTLLFTSGVNNGVSRTVKAWDGTNATLTVPLPAVPTVGDAVTISAGCDHLQSTCLNKFSNLVHFRGFPYIPIPETAI